jgi:hypothetical protein
MRDNFTESVEEPYAPVMHHTYTGYTLKTTTDFNDYADDADFRPQMAWG